MKKCALSPNKVHKMVYDEALKFWKQPNREKMPYYRIVFHCEYCGLVDIQTIYE